MKRKRFSLQTFFADQSGTILILTGLGFLFLVGIGGAAYDLGRQQLVRQRIQQAADAGALAGAGRQQGTSDADRYNTALAVYSLNYPSTYFGVARPTPTVNVVNDINVSVSATTTLPTAFVGNLGINTLTSAGKSIVQIKKDINKLDIILVLDNTGSMGVFYDVGTTNSLNGAADIRPHCIAGWMAYDNYTPAQANTLCSFWEGNVGFNRLNAMRYSATQLTNDLMSPNLNDTRMAAVSWDLITVDKLDFTTDPVPMRNFLQYMYGRGATDSTSGLQGAMAMSPGFRSDAVHAIILMTDGKNHPFQLAYNATSIPVCTALKNLPRTIVFTIGFGAEVLTDSISQQFLSDCATGPNGTGSPKPNEGIYYFPVSDATQLKAAFDTIAGNLQKVRILQ